MIKIYDEDSYVKEFEAIVQECVTYNGRFAVVLDRTAFFPTAGGQSCDTGTLSDEAVLDVQIIDETIYHITDKAFTAGETVFGKIEFKARFRKMQHHSAEHIVSGLAHTLFGVENVGFHLNDREVTIDYDKELSNEEIIQLEKAANDVVQANIEIIAEYPTPDKLKTTAYRSKKEIDGDIRLVTIPGVDVCACCAPHLKRTGEIGVIKLKEPMRHRGGIRIRMICGNDALADYRNKCENAAEISRLLCAKQNEIAESVKHLSDELEEMKRKYSALTKEFAVYKADKIPKSDGVCCVFEEFIDTDGMRSLVNIVKQKSKIAAVFSGNDKVGYSYIIASEEINMRDLSKKINDELCGKGGGSSDMIQGFLKSRRSEIEAFFETDFDKN